MNTCICRLWSASLVFLLAIGMVAPAAAQKAALVRDVDRPSVNPVAAKCSAFPIANTGSCIVYTVPANMVLVVETVVFEIGGVLPAGARFKISPTIGTIGTQSETFFPRTEPSADKLVHGFAQLRAYYTAGTILEARVEGVAGAQVDYMIAGLFGHLVAAGSP